MMGEVFISAKCYSNEITRSFFLGGGGKRGWGRGFKFMMCVCLSHSHHSFSPQIFFWGKGRGEMGPLSFRSLLLYYIYWDLVWFISKKGPPRQSCTSYKIIICMYRHKGASYVNNITNKQKLWWKIQEGNSRTKRSLQFIHIFKSYLPLPTVFIIPKLHRLYPVHTYHSALSQAMQSFKLTTKAKKKSRSLSLSNLARLSSFFYSYDRNACLSLLCTLPHYQGSAYNLFLFFFLLFFRLHSQNTPHRPGSRVFFR